MVEGHADARGTNEYNLALGERRAGAARDYLVSLGIPADRVTIVSKGEERRSAANENEACWQKNRRGHFVFTRSKSGRVRSGRSSAAIGRPLTLVAGERMSPTICSAAGAGSAAAMIGRPTTR